MQCRVRYLLNFDLKICSGQVCGVRTCGRTSARPFFSTFFNFYAAKQKKENWKKKNFENFLRVQVRVRPQKLACGCVRRTLRILCDVRAGAAQKVRTLRVCQKEYEMSKCPKNALAPLWSALVSLKTSSRKKIALPGNWVARYASWNQGV